MKADELISKAENFAMSFIAKLKDPSEQPERKQLFFMDNQDELKKYMTALQTTLNGLRENQEDSEELTDDETLLIQRAESVVMQIKQAVSDFQQSLVINSDVQEEDITPALTEETITEAMKTNKTTQDINANMNAIAEQRKTQVPQYNYVLVCDGTLTMLNVATKEELNSQINAVANQGQYKSIQLFKMQYTPVPLKQQTILTV